MTTINLNRERAAQHTHEPRIISNNHFTSIICLCYSNVSTEWYRPRSLHLEFAFFPSFEQHKSNPRSLMQFDKLFLFSLRSHTFRESNRDGLASTSMFLIDAHRKWCDLNPGQVKNSIENKTYVNWNAALIAVDSNHFSVSDCDSVCHMCVDCVRVRAVCQVARCR